MSALKVVVADDESNIVQDMRRKIERAAPNDTEVITLSGQDLTLAIRTLRERHDAWENNPDWSPAKYDSVIDYADVLVLDYDLRGLYGGVAYITGEDVASLARKYSRSGPIVSVNRYGRARFDLRSRSYSDTWAELSIAHEDLGNPGLWHDKWDSYRPWSWPVLPRLSRLFEKRVSFAIDHKDDTIIESLGMPRHIWALLPSELYDRMEADYSTTSFKELTRDVLFSPKMAPPSDTQLMRSAAAKLSAWLNDIVLPGLEVLIDAPHLCSLYPSLLKGKETKETLDRLCRIDPLASLPLKQDIIKASQFRLGYWLDRPVWWTELILENREIQENSEPWSSGKLSWVFAEDTSTFHDPDVCRPYRSEGLFKKRFIRRPTEASNVSYIPESWLAI